MLRFLTGLTLNKTLSAGDRGAFPDGAPPGFPDRHRVWLTLEAKY